MENVSFYFALFETIALLFHLSNIRSRSRLRLYNFAAAYFWRAFCTRTHQQRLSFRDVSCVLSLYTYALIHTRIIYASADYT